MNDYSYWQAALALGDAIKNDRDLRVTETPMPGFYRTSNNGKGVAIWYDSDGVNMLVNGYDTPAENITETWLHVCRNPVTEEQWKAFNETGRWHDVDPVIAETLGHNIEGATDPDTIQSLLTQLTAAAEQYKRITSDEQSKLAHGIRARINQLKLRATQLHKAEKEPHLRAGQAVDRRWNPMIKDADGVASGIGRAMGAWEDEKRAAIRRAEWEAEEARRKAEEARKAGEPVPEPQTTQAPLPEPVSTVRSGYGRAASVRTRNVVVDITDLAVLLKRYSQTLEIRNTLLDLAQKDVDAGIVVEGVRTEERSTVR